MAAAQYADDLRKAMKGLGTDEDSIIAVLGHRTRTEIQEIAHEFENRHKRNLEKDLISECSGHFLQVVQALVRSVPDYASELVEKAVVGAGTNENVLIDVIAPLSGHELAELKKAFARLYGRHEGALAERINKDVSTLLDFGKLTQVLLEGNRTSDPSKVQEEAEKLFKAGEGKLGTDEERFISIIGRRSPEHLKAVSEAYKAKHGHTLEQAIKKETSGDFEKLLLACLYTREEYFAIRLHDAIDGAGTNDSLLVRCFGLNDKPQLIQIGQAYRRIFGKSLENDLKGDLSGDYRKLCIALIEKY